MMRRSTKTLVLPLIALVAMTSLSACSKKKATPTAKGNQANLLVKDDTLAALVPTKVRTAGKLTVATDASYAPNEFFAADHKTVIGFDVELGKAIGKILGLDVTFTNTGFEGIIPSLGSRYDLGMSSFTDNKKREKVVDMVTYFNAGTSFVTKAGSTFAPTTLADLCGHPAAAEKATTQLDDITAQAKACASSGKGKLTVLPFPDQNGANLAVIAGRADVVLADAPVNAYAVKQSKGALQISGKEYGAAPYGIAVPKGAAYQGLSDAILGAVKKLIAGGQYTKILDTWGLGSGAITAPVVNGATS